ncbi:MAG: RluA family pseudouridine synthase [Clostridia bacterium]|nr:RluA family pseudouridine synthase [Clostridia bacterium]
MILYNDPQLLVCSKPAGLVSQRAENGRDLPSALEAALAAQGESCTLYPVHRLDRETAGLMVFAKTQASAAALSAQIAAGGLKKRYFAVLRGVPEQERGTLEDLLFHDRQRNKTYPVKRMRKGVHPAKLAYTVLAAREGLSLVSVRLGTGHTHQIRVQFASRRLPLWGDGKYGGGPGALALFACGLTFTHPATGELRTFHALPDPAAAPWDRFAAELTASETE